MCYLWVLVCVMCGLESVLCAVFSLCYVQSLISVMCSLQARTSSLRSSMLRFARSEDANNGKGKGPKQCQISNDVCKPARHSSGARNK